MPANLISSIALAADLQSTLRTCRLELKDVIAVELAGKREQDRDPPKLRLIPSAKCGNRPPREIVD
jgi:hypothetical protein